MSSELLHAIDQIEKRIAYDGLSESSASIPIHFLKTLLEAAKRAKTSDEQEVLDGKRVILPTDKVMADAYVLVGMSWLKNHDPDEGNG